MINRDIPVSPEIFFNGIIDHWDVTTAHDFVLRLAREWGYESFALDLGIALIKLAKEMEADQKLKELLETPAPWDTSGASGASGEEQAEPASDDGWIPWNGGECPVSRQSHVAVRLRADSFPGIHIARDLRWEWAEPGSPWGWEPENDIIAYKVVD